MELASRLVELLWIGALAAIPLSLLAAVLCRWGGCRPATRHAIWTAVLASFVLPFLAAALWKPVWIEAGRAAQSIETATERARDSFRGVRWGFGLVRDVLFAPSSRSADPTRLAKQFEAPRSPSKELAPGASIADQDRRASRTVEPWTSDPSFRIGAPLGSVFGATRERSGDLDDPRPIVGMAPSNGRPGGLLAAILGSQESTRVQGSGTSLPSETGVIASENARAPRRTGEDRVLSGRSLAGSPDEPTGVSANGRRDSKGRIVSLALDRAAGWIDSIPSVRSAMSDLPPVPVSLWTGGLAAALVISGWRTMRLRRMVARGTSASAATVDLVEECAERIGLTRVPQTVMVSERVSPLVWCGGTARLVLPETLWKALDPMAKRAVVMHELAHLRRLDHRLCWLVGMVGLLYWWHPVSWWAQRRLRDEADLCCDAWVTTLLPGSRRAYAEVLLATKVFLSEAAGAGRGAHGPHVVAGLSMVSGMSGRSKRMARRLTMVMKDRVAPRASVMGVLAAISIAAAGTFVTPGLACPPEKSAANARSEARAGHGQAVVIAGSKAKRAAELAVQAAAEGEASGSAFLGEAPALEAMRAAQPRAGASAESLSSTGGDSLGELVERLAELEVRIARLNGRAAAALVGPASPWRASGENRAISSELAARDAHRIAVRPNVRVAIPSNPVGTVAPASPLGIRVPQPAIAPHALAVPSVPRATVPAPTLTAPGPGTSPRSYALPSGKLRAMIALMERQDVPIFIERHTDKIVVHATANQHEAFGAFIKLIHPEDASSDGVSALGTTSPFLLYAPSAPAYTQRIKEYRRALDGMQRNREQIQRRIEQSQRRSESVRERGEKLRETSEQIQERAEAAKLDAERAMLMAKAHELHAAAEASDAEAAAMEAQDEELESQLADVESAFDEVEAKIDELEGLDSEDSDEEPAPSEAPAAADPEPAEAPVVEVSEPPTDTSDSEVTETEGDSDGDADRTAPGEAGTCD